MISNQMYLCSCISDCVLYSFDGEVELKSGDILYYLKREGCYTYNYLLSKRNVGYDIHHSNIYLTGEDFKNKFKDIEEHRNTLLDELIWGDDLSLF